jgi:hypothetical protein
MRHVPIFLALLVPVTLGASGCTDPNPTFVFDAAPAAREAGADGPDGSTTEAGPTDGGAEAASDGVGVGQ